MFKNMPSAMHFVISGESLRMHSSHLHLGKKFMNIQDEATIQFVWVYRSFKWRHLHPVCQAWKTPVMIVLKIPFAEFEILCKHQCLGIIQKFWLKPDESHLRAVWWATHFVRSHVGLSQRTQDTQATSISPQEKEALWGKGHDSTTVGQ